MTSPLRGAVLAAALVALSGCAPCAGTDSCRTEPQVIVSGRVVDRNSGQGVGRVSVTFGRTGGVELLADSQRVMADGDGFFRLVSTARTAGIVTGILHVAPQGSTGYVIDGVSLRTTETAGDGQDLGRIAAVPYVMLIAELRSRAAKGAVIPFASVTFRRTGGVQTAEPVLETGADAYGRVPLIIETQQSGMLEGTLTVSGTGLARRFDIPVRAWTRYQEAPTRDVTVLNVGTTLLWAGEVYRRGTNEHRAGIQVEFQRTGGINVSPAQFATTTNTIGLFPLQPTPSEEGELVGTITVRPPSPWKPIVVPDVRVQTTSDDSVRLAVRIAYGAQVFGTVEPRYRTTGEKVSVSTVVTYRRISGVTATSEVSRGNVSALGLAPILLATDAAGETVGDLEVQLGEPWGTDTIRNVRLPSTEDDVQRFFGTYPVGRWFPQVARVADRDTDRAIPGARVTFTRVSGAPISPNPYSVTPNADGYFGIRPQPLADGEVVGDLTIELPAPYSSTTLRGIRLLSSRDDTLRFIGAFTFVKPN